MMKKLVQILSWSNRVVVLLALGAPAAAAQTELGRWSVSFDAGVQLALAGDAHTGGSGRVLNLPASVSAKSYGDVFGQGFYWAAGLGYGVGERGEIRVQGAYTANPAEQLQVGTVANFPLLADFEDYKAFAMDFGYRQYLSARDRRVRPFFGGGAGFTRVDRIRGTFSVPAAGATLPNVGFYDASTVPSFNANGGVQFAVSSRLLFQGLADFRWHGDLNDQDGLAGTGLEGLNDEGRRWTLPVTGGVTVRF